MAIAECSARMAVSRSVRRRCGRILEVSAVVVSAKKVGKNAPFLRVDLGSDVTRPCGGGGVRSRRPALARSEGDDWRRASPHAEL